MSSEFKPPTWVGPPKPGLHLDIVKNDSVLQKLLIDDKEVYLFGRNRDTCDFPLQHQSCSRVHAALVHHKYLNRPFLIDLGSAHGSFVGSIQLEPHKPQQLLPDTSFSFGASTRKYTLREKPQPVALLQEEGSGGEGEGGALLGITELDNEVDDITQYNTAHNRQISTIGITTPTDELSRKRNRKSSLVTFNEEEEVINPEDIDPSVGRFRNLVTSSVVVPAKRPRSSDSEQTTPTSSKPHPFTQPLRSPITAPPPELYSNDVLSPSASGERSAFSFSSVLSRGITSAPPVENPEASNVTTPTSNLPSWSFSPSDIFEDVNMPRKKKYAKEAWPGKKPTAHIVV